MDYMLGKILIVGGAGFIGTALVERLLREGLEITVLDINIPNVKLSNVRYIESDVIDYEGLDELVAAVDVVFNFASQLGIKYGIEKPLSQFNNNFFSTYTLLESCLKSDTRLIHASSSAIYGQPVMEVLTEDSPLMFDNFNTGSWNYAFTKLSQEMVIHAFAKERKLKVQIIRYFNCIGGSQKPDLGHVVPSFIQAALSGAPLSIHGDGRQERTFIHISDAIEATVLILQHYEQGEVYNVGGIQSISMKDLAQMVIEQTGSKSSMEFEHMDSVFCANHREPIKRVPNIDKIRRLGYRAKYPFPKSIQKVTASFQKTMKQSV